jgi:hypothetical protein
METILNVRPGQVAIVIGVDHKIQHFVSGLAPNDPRTRLRLRFHDFLGEITGGYPVDVICEEASTAWRASLRHSRRTKAFGMSTSRCRLSDEIHSAYLASTPSIQNRRSLPSKKPIGTISEKHTWFYELLRAIPRARAVIVICGVIHMSVIVQALHAKFARVEQYDVTTLGWFDKTLL